MKYFLLVAISFLGMSSRSYSQEKRIEKYCEVSLTSYGKASFDLGTINECDFKDTTIRLNVQQVLKLKTTGNILNYMSKIGWSLVTIAIIDYTKYFYFKRVFTETELVGECK